MFSLKHDSRLVTLSRNHPYEISQSKSINIHIHNWYFWVDSRLEVHNYVRQMYGFISPPTRFFTAPSSERVGLNASHISTENESRAAPNIHSRYQRWCAANFKWLIYTRLISPINQRQLTQPLANAGLIKVGDFLGKSDRILKKLMPATKNVDQISRALLGLGSTYYYQFLFSVQESLQYYLSDYVPVRKHFIPPLFSAYCRLESLTLIYVRLAKIKHWSGHGIVHDISWGILGLGIETQEEAAETDTSN